MSCYSDRMAELLERWCRELSCAEVEALEAETRALLGEYQQERGKCLPKP